MIDQLEQGFQPRDTSARDVQHDASPGKIGIILNDQLRQPATIFTKQLPESCNCGSQPELFPVMDGDAASCNDKAVTLGMSGTRRGL